MKRLATLLPLILALAAPAAAETLHAQVTVDHPMIRVADLFAGAPKAIAERAIAPAPAPGRSTVFAATTLAQIAQDAGLSWKPLSRFDRAVVTRASRPVGADDVERALLTALRAQGLAKDMKVELVNRRLSLDAATGAGAPFTLSNVQYDREDKDATATVMLASGPGASRPIDVRANVYRVIQAPELARNLSHGQLVGHDDLVFAAMRADQLEPSIVVDPDSIIGKTPRSAVRAGVPLRRSDFVAPIVIPRGSMVIVTLTTPNLALTVKGKALDNGYNGQTIRVENTRSHVTVEGVVTGTGRVAVALPNLALR